MCEYVEVVQLSGKRARWELENVPCVSSLRQMIHKVWGVHPREQTLLLDYEECQNTKTQSGKVYTMLRRSREEGAEIEKWEDRLRCRWETASLSERWRDHAQIALLAIRNSASNFRLVSEELGRDRYFLATAV